MEDRMFARRRHQIFPIIAATLFLLSLTPLAAQAKVENRPTLFKLRTEKTVMYFFGSVHIGRSDMYPLPEAVQKAFAASDNLVVEADILDAVPGEVMSLYRNKLSYRSPDSLDRHLDAEHLDKLQKALGRFGLPYERIAAFKPILVDSILSEYGAANLGYSPRDGIDLFFMRAAKEKKKRVLELETLAEQVEALGRIPEQAQIQLLAASLDELDTMKDDLLALIEAWRKGDLDACYAMEEKEILNVPGLESVFPILITERNRTMEKRIKAMIDRGGAYFVVVGTGHFAGPESVIDLLRKEGFTVTRE
jgi:uncharacterized protein YbaP (TraB family)